MSKIIDKFWEIIEIVAKFFFKIFFRIIKKELDDKTWAKINEFVKFCVVGCMNALVAWLTSLIVIFVLEGLGFGGKRFGIEDFVGNLAVVIAFFAKVLNSYYWNGKYVFNSGEKKKFSDHLRCYGKLVISYSASLVIGLLLNILWEKIGLTNKLWIPCNEIITLPMNYLMDKFFAFRKLGKK